MEFIAKENMYKEEDLSFFITKNYLINKLNVVESKLNNITSLIEEYIKETDMTEDVELDFGEFDYELDSSPILLQITNNKKAFITVLLENGYKVSLGDRNVIIIEQGTAKFY